MPETWKGKVPATQTVISVGRKTFIGKITKIPGLSVIVHDTNYLTNTVAQKSVNSSVGHKQWLIKKKKIDDLCYSVTDEHCSEYAPDCSPHFPLRTLLPSADTKAIAIRGGLS